MPIRFPNTVNGSLLEPGSLSVAVRWQDVVVTGLEEPCPPLPQQRCPNVAPVQSRLVQPPWAFLQPMNDALVQQNLKRVVAVQWEDLDSTCSVLLVVVPG